MTSQEYKKIHQMLNQIIALIKWNGAPLESKKNKIIKEISLIIKYCFSCVDKDESPV